jgi:hypothetical protein
MPTKLELLNNALVESALHSDAKTQATVAAVKNFLNVCEGVAAPSDEQIDALMAALEKSDAEAVEKVTLSQVQYLAKHYHNFKGVLSSINTNDTVRATALFSTVKITELTKIKMSHPAPLANEKVENMDLTNHPQFEQLKIDKNKPDYKGYYVVNNRIFTLWKGTEGNLKGTTRADPIYDDTALKDFLGKFGFEYHARPEDKRFSGTFAEPPHANTINKYDKSGNLIGRAPVEKPIEQRTIKNMTVYFKKKEDCDYAILDTLKSKTLPKNN